MMKRVLQSVVGLTLVIYPFIIYLGLEALPVKAIALFMMAMFVLRLLVTRGGEAGFYQRKVLRRMIIPGALCGLGLSLFSLIMNSDQALLFYPVFISATGLLVFGWSLYRPPSMIECFARMLDRNFPGEKPDEAIAYTRAVTGIWCVFFVVNGAVALWTAINSDRAFWVFYNGFLSYVLMGTLLGGEWLYRKWVLKV